MNILPVISNFKDQMEVIYKDFHQHPEIGFEEVRTSQIVAQYLNDFGVDEVHTEIGVTGVVGVSGASTQEPSCGVACGYGRPAHS